ncbi:hypothetical protein BDM02DRAFT_3115333 [Thelephora ganbajun]|uniref:Uncharacterized protein n=1 Tax=Thelephora ganbajun TaxID=370292 RepID=A0ACB6ZFU4_THEGA|nr:hypothetical protein BDM02DRAFT_3115333 [Thelephora ganbajun]
MFLASGPVGHPSIYDPSAPKGSRWSSHGLLASAIPRYPSPTIFPTTYNVGYSYPPCCQANAISFH